MHFGAPVVVLPLRNKQLMLNTPIQRFSIHFTTPKKTGQAATRLSIDALPETAHPVIQIDWPVKKGTKPLSSSHILNERCCYWEFYTTKFAIPERAVPGTAKITVSVPDAAFPLELACDNFEMPVVAETSQTPGD